MSEHHDEPVGEASESPQERFEQARMTRRQALRKMGLTSGLAIFSLLTIDDLARVSAKKLQEHKATREIGDTLAEEFRTAGVSLAAVDNVSPYGYTYMATGNWTTWGSGCTGAHPNNTVACNNCCDVMYDNCMQPPSYGSISCGNQRTQCYASCAAGKAV